MLARLHHPVESWPTLDVRIQRSHIATAHGVDEILLMTGAGIAFESFDFLTGLVKGDGASRAVLPAFHPRNRRCSHFPDRDA